MAVDTKAALGILVVAASLAILSDLLLRVVPLGINVVVWTGAGILLTGIISWQSSMRFTGAGRWLAIPLVFFVAALAWRDSVMLAALNIAVVLALLSLAAVTTVRGRLRVGWPAGYLLSGFYLFVLTAAGPLPLLFHDVRWDEVPRGRWLARVVAVGRGVAIALPLLLVFGLLFAAADAAFQGWLSRLFRWDPEVVVHLLWIGLWFWLVAGLLRLLFLGPHQTDLLGAPPVPLRLGAIEVAVALGLLNVLFLAFVAVQFRYLFGGAALIETTATLTYAEYARRGFFELVAVAALVLPLLLLLDWLIRDTASVSTRIGRTLSAVLILLLFLVMASALQRMRLYQAEFGLTELRLSTTAFMLWLTAVFVWFLATVLRAQRGRFMFGVLVSGLLAAVALNALNPDDLIVRTNLGRALARQPRSFDAYYPATLSADAVPALVAGLDALGAADRRTVATALLDRWTETDSDPRTWNWSRARAIELVRDNRTALEAALAGG